MINQPPPDQPPAQRPNLLPDPVTLVYYAPSISYETGEDWRGRSLRSWIALASLDGLTVTDVTGQHGRGFGGHWCGDVAIDGLIYRVLRGPRKRVSIIDPDLPGDRLDVRWILQQCTYVEPLPGQPFITENGDRIDPRRQPQ